MLRCPPGPTANSASTVSSYQTHFDINSLQISFDPNSINFCKKPSSLVDKGSLLIVPKSLDADLTLELLAQKCNAIEGDAKDLLALPEDDRAKQLQKLSLNADQMQQALADLRLSQDELWAVIGQKDAIGNAIEERQGDGLLLDPAVIKEIILEHLGKGGQVTEKGDNSGQTEVEKSKDEGIEAKKIDGSDGEGMKEANNGEHD